MTKEKRYHALARRYLFDAYFDPLSRGEDAIAGTHAYSHVNALGSALRAYLTDGDEKYLRAAKNAYDLIEKQEYASGGYGPDEIFIKTGSDTLFEKLAASDRHLRRPCCAYGSFKFIRYLIAITGESRYATAWSVFFITAFLVRGHSGGWPHVLLRRLPKVGDQAVFPQPVAVLFRHVRRR